MYKEDIRDVVVTSHDMRKSASGVWTDTLGYPTKCNNKRTYGENTPQFHRRLKAGELLPFTPFLQLENKTVTAEVDYHCRNNSDGSEARWWGNLLDASGDLVSWTAAGGVGSGKTDDNAIMQAAGARQISASWDVLTFAAEVGQTVSMFKGLLTKVINLLHSKPPGTPWNIWLELRYGWRTLAYDISDIEKAFSKSSEQRFNRTSAGQSISWETNTSTTYVQSWWTMVLKSKTQYSLNARGKVITKGAPPRFNINILKTAWEVTRLSFVVDWFINVGRFIDALQFALTLESRAGLGKYIEVKSSSWMEFTPNSTWTILKKVAKVDREALITMRAPASVPLIPLISVNIDRFKVLDLVSLLIQALRR